MCATAIPRWIYYAHTRFDAEFPSYFLRGRRIFRWIGRGLDRLSCEMSMTIALAPSLGAYLNVPYLLPPWPLWIQFRLRKEGGDNPLKRFSMRGILIPIKGGKMWREQLKGCD